MLSRVAAHILKPLALWLLLLGAVAGAGVYEQPSFTGAHAQSQGLLTRLEARQHLLDEFLARAKAHPEKLREETERLRERLKAAATPLDHLPEGLRGKVLSLADEATRTKFLTDYENAPEAFRQALEARPELVEGWKVLNSNGALRKNIDVNELVSYKIKQSGISPDDLQKTFNNAPDKQQWIINLSEEVGAKARNLSGVSSGKGIKIDGDWLKGTHGNAGLFPESIATKLKGKSFKSFDEFRQEFWKAVAEDPNLTKQFTQDNFYRMKAGAAPIADAEQWHGGQKSYILHHKTPIHQGGAVYDVDNILIVTPRYHKDILTSLYHFGN